MHAHDLSKVNFAPTENFSCVSTTSFAPGGGKMRDPGNEVGVSKWSSLPVFKP